MRKDRALARITELNDNELTLIIPGWKVDEQIRLERSILPQHISTNLKVGSRMTCLCNLAAESTQELNLDQFYILAPPESNDGL